MPANEGGLLLFLIYLFYGAAFFAIGVAITSRLKTFASLRIAGLFWLLALFAFSHCLHEWLELALHLELATPPHALRIRYLSLSLLLTSFLLLYLFGINLHRILNARSRPFLIGLLLVTATIFLLLLLHSHDILAGREYLNVIDYSIRKLFALPASWLAGGAFILYARRLRTLSSKGAGNFTGAGLAFMAYGIFAGLYPSTATVVMLPIQFWRGLTAFVILHFIMYALNIFLAQRDALISERLKESAHFEKLGSIGRLAAGIAHEINNPLANVSLQLELLKKDPAIAALPEKTLARLRATERNVEKTARIAGELLLFADKRLDSLKLEPVNLRIIADTAWQGLAHRREHHRLLNHLPDHLPISGVPLKLEQLFRNLLLNAVDAMPEGGEIEIYTRNKGQKKITVTILDRGEGIPPAMREMVMEPFFTTKEVGKGTGLGLAICFGIMAQHNGSLEIAPREEGTGTIVTLTFPGDLAGNGEKLL